MNRTALAELRSHSPFTARRALERLREGLYDPFAVRLLTAHQEELDTRLEADLTRLEAGEAMHLCVCGPYGQGKSHTLTYLRERALERGYAVSAINLDPREAPLHQFRQVYRALVETLTFPRGAEDSSTSLVDAWQSWAKARALPSEESSRALAALLPDAMPHLFKAVMTALVQATLPVPQGRRALQRYRDYRPTDFPTTLRRALCGESVPVARVRPALKYRQVAFYREHSLAVRDDEPFVQMIAALSQLFRRMGYQGWVLLFDEGEAMIQVRSPLRGRSYRILHRLLYPESAQPCFYPVFAFTPDFFQHVHDEDYGLPYFDRDYAVAWRDVSVYQLRSLSQSDWRELCATLVSLHGAAYQWAAEREGLLPRLFDRLEVLPLQDTRSTLKALVDELDQAQQEVFFAESATT